MDNQSVTVIVVWAIGMVTGGLSMYIYMDHTATKEKKDAEKKERIGFLR